MSSDALDHITIKGFKSIASIEKLPLKPINLLIGANGAGKSNFIGSFAFLHSVREGRLQEYVRMAGGAEQLLHMGSRTTPEIQIEVSFGEGLNAYQLTLKPTADDSLYPAKEIISSHSSEYPRPWTNILSTRAQGLEAGISDPGLKRVGEWVRHKLGRWRLYHVHDTSSASPMRKTAQIHDNAFLRSDGANLPAFLYLLSAKHPHEYELIRQTMRRVAPFFDDFILEPDSHNQETIRLAWRHRESDLYFGASALSDGSLRFMALAALFLQPDEYLPSVIMVDEPELGLHPFAITLLASLVKQVATSTQVILSTQSSLLLDHFQSQDVLVAERVGGGTSLHRLEEAPLKEWLQEYSLGQLWEKNELGGRPRRG